MVFIVSFIGIRAQSILDNTELSLSNSYDSKYVSEGRCNLANGGLSSFNADMAFHWLNLNMWYGSGLEEDYRELQFSAGLAFDISDIGINLRQSQA